MFVNKISNKIQNQAFKGYQHEVNNVGDTVQRFNYVFDYETQDAFVEFYKTKRNNDVFGGFEVVTEQPIATVKIEKGGTPVNFDNITNLDRDEAFAYRIVIKDKKSDDSKTYAVADTGVKINNDTFTIVHRNGTTPQVQGAGYLAYPDGQYVGARYAGFDEVNTGEIIIDKEVQKEMENVIRTFSNKTGGNIAGLEHNLEYLAANGYTIQPTNPVAGMDNKSSHHYWNKNNMQISDDMGNIENYKSYTRKLFQKGIININDGTFTSEGLEGIHFQYALRWADKNPQSYYWFRMSGLKDASLGLGVVPRHKENLRHRVINAPYIINEITGKKEKNLNYDPSKETMFQIYDGSQVTEAQLARLDKPIENYQKLKSGNPLAINSHDDTLINFVFEVDPKEYEKRIDEFLEYNKGVSTPLKANSPDGTILIGQFSNFRIDKKTEGGFVTWDANTDIVKMNYHISGYDEKLNQAILDRSQRDYETMMQQRGAYEVQDMALQAAKYWTGTVVKDTQILYSAQVLKNVKTEEDVKNLIEKGLLPKRGALSQEVINNVLNGYFKLSPKGILDKDNTTVKALMKVPLDALEFAENTQGVLSTSYFSNRATSAETLGKTRFELMQAENPHLVQPYANTYLKTNLLFTSDIKNFADEIIKKVNESSVEKLLDENGDYTEFGEYVIELLGPTITKYAFLKSLTGDKLKTKILPNGEITYDYVNIKEMTSLKSLGINANNPTDEAAQLYKLIEKGMSKLDNTDVDYIARSISQTIQGMDTNSFRLGEAESIVAALGLAWRLDALKDVMDQDAVRNRDTSFDDTWQNLIGFWKMFVQSIKSENPNSYIVAELTDIPDLMRDNLGEKANCYDHMPELGYKFKTVPDALIKFFNETGITSEAAYSYFFTDLLKTFAADFTDGSIDTSDRRAYGFIDKVHELIRTRGIDYTRNLFTFIGNHDKPRVIHGLAVDMTLFHGSLNIYDKNNNLNYELNRNNRIESMLQLANADKFENLPLEAKLNIDNPNYFMTVSTKAVATSQLLRNSINDVLPNKVKDEEIEYLKLALVDLTNGNFLGSGNTVMIPSINIPEISSFENALKKMLSMAGITLTEKEFNEVIKEANNRELLEKYLIHGDFSNNTNNAENRTRNIKMAETILRGAYENVHSGEYDYTKYSTYTVSVAGILREAFLKVKGSDDTAKRAFLDGARTFVKKYDNAVIEESRTKLPFYESSANAMAKNGYAGHDIKLSTRMLIEQAEYRARKDGKLGANEHFINFDKIYHDVYINAVEPPTQKAIMLYTFLAALVGLPTIYGGDEFGMTGYDEKTKNIYLQCRNPIPWSELDEGLFKDYRRRIQSAMNSALSLRSREGINALNNGTAYQLETSNKQIPAFMMQDGYGNMTVSVFNAMGINPKNRHNYFESLGINASNRAKFFADNGIETINPDNPYIPIQASEEIDYIALGVGLSLPLGMKFINSDARDRAIYEVRRILDAAGKDTGRRGIFRVGGKKITLNGITAKNGAMILKHLAFRGDSRAINKKYNIVTNPYKQNQNVISGKNLSIIAQ